MLRRRRGDARHQAGLRDLLDVLAARLRPDRPRRRRPESAGRVRDRPRRLRRRRRPDAHGTLRHRLPAHAAGHDDHGAAQRSRGRPDARPRARRSTRRPRSAIRAARPAASTTSRSRRSCSAGPRCCAAGRGVAILALGNTVDAALDAYDLLEATASSRRSSTCASSRRSTRRCCSNSRRRTGASSRWRSTSLAGGFGSAVVEFVNDRGLDVAVERIGVPNVLVQHAKPEAQRAQFGLSGENVAARVRALQMAPPVPATRALATGSPSPRRSNVRRAEASPAVLFPRRPAHAGVPSCFPCCSPPATAGRRRQNGRRPSSRPSPISVQHERPQFDLTPHSSLAQHCRG